MTILGKNILHQHGPFVDFAVLDERPAIDEWQYLPYSEYEGGVFFELADSLLDCYCDITRSYAPFDPHGFALLAKPHDIYELAAKLLMWELQIANAPAFYFNQLLKRHELTKPPSGTVSPEQLKADLLETLHFVIDHLLKAAASGKCVVIAGF